MQKERTLNTTPPHLCDCPKAGHGFPTAYVVIFVVLYCSTVRFLDIGGIADRPSLLKTFLS